MQVKIEEIDNKGAAYVEDKGSRLAQMTYSIASPTFIIIDHTEVDDQLRGTGTGKKLLMAIVDRARKNQTKIMPLCPFAKSVFNKDQSIQDVLK